MVGVQRSTPHSVADDWIEYDPSGLSMVTQVALSGTDCVCDVSQWDMPRDQPDPERLCGVPSDRVRSWGDSRGQPRAGSLAHSADLFPTGILIARLALAGYWLTADMNTCLR